MRKLRARFVQVVPHPAWLADVEADTGRPVEIAEVADVPEAERPLHLTRSRAHAHEHQPDQGEPMQRRHWRKPVALAMTAALALAACGGDDDDDADGHRATRRHDAVETTEAAGGRPTTADTATDETTADTATDETTGPTTTDGTPRRRRRRVRLHRRRVPGRG